MRHYSYDAAIRRQWKSYPVRVVGPRPSGCHKQPTLLVQSLEGGFVTQNCSKQGCNKSAIVTDADVSSLNLWVSCPECRAPMAARTVGKNYAYVCDSCDLYVRLADLLPYWTDISRP